MFSNHLIPWDCFVATLLAMMRLPTFYEIINFDLFVKSRKPTEFVIPAKAGIQSFQDILDPGFRRGDDPIDLLRVHQIQSFEKRNSTQAKWFQGLYDNPF